MNVITITENNFDEVVLQSETPIIINFVADWCGPCRQAISLLEEIGKDYEEKLLIGQIDVDDCPSLAAQNYVRNIPAMLLFRNGKLIEKQIGTCPKEVLEKKFKL